MGYGNVYEVIAPAQESVLYNFCSQPGCSDGFAPVASMIEDQFGNLYGTTKLGGTGTNCQGGCGVVFEIVQSLGQKAAKEAVWHTIVPAESASSRTAR